MGSDKPSWKTAWVDATDLLAQRGNRLRLILAVLTVVSCAALSVFLPIQVLSIVLIFAERRFWVCVIGFAVLVIAVLVGLIFPLASGLLHLAARMEAGEETTLRDVLFAFTERGAYRRAWGCGCLVGLPLGLLALIPYCLNVALLSPLEPTLEQTVLVALLSVLSDVLVCFLLLGRFCKPFAVLTGKRPTRTCAQSERRMGTRYWVRLIPHLLLSVLTLFIYLIADCLPRMLILYCRLCREYDQDLTIQPKELPKR